jgi:DNA-binding transcriptional LysR family regulator
MCGKRRPTSIDWDLLRVFLAIARKGQILAASRHLGLNHVTVARRLDRIEASLGIKLFERGSAGVTLTRAGESLLPSAERIEAEFALVNETTRDETVAIRGTVRIGAPEGLGDLFLAPVLGSFGEAHPDLVIELVPLPRNLAQTCREVDLALSARAPVAGRLMTTRLGDCSLGVYASRDYVGEHGRPNSLDELASHVAVGGNDDLAGATDPTAVLERRAKRRFRCASLGGRIEAIAAGVGIGVVHDFVARRMPRLMRILPHVVFRQSYHLISHADFREPKRIRVCHDEILRSFRQRRSEFLE